MKITISETARISLDEIIDFLRVRWTAKEINVLKMTLKSSERQ
ncbi:hypothetical protein [Chryseobacterium sp. sg2396]|nr:hypothetical protein [uncultured Chryseobacterium sp.]